MLTGLVLAVDLFQEHVLKQGPQNNESAIEQAKDEYISDCKRSSEVPTCNRLLTVSWGLVIRGQYKNITGKEIPIKDK